MQSLSRALTVLAELGRHDRPCGVTELATAVGLHKSTVHRMLATFCEHGLARRVAENRYAVGEGFAALCAPAAAPVPAARQADAVVSELGGRLGRTVVLAEPRAASAAALRAATRGGLSQLVLEVTAVATGAGSTAPGLRDPVSLRRSALGRAYLSGLPAGAIDGQLARGDDPQALLLAVRRVRSSGFAHNPRPVASLPRMLAVPVHDADGTCAGALGAELRQGPTPTDEVRRIVAALAQGARLVAAPARDARYLAALDERRGA